MKIIEKDGGFLYLPDENKILLYKGYKLKKAFFSVKNDEIMEVDKDAND